MIALLAASGLGRLLGAPDRWHPLAQFGACARRIEFSLHPRASRPAAWGRALALVPAVAPWVPDALAGGDLAGAGHKWRRPEGTSSSAVRGECA